MEFLRYDLTTEDGWCEFQRQQQDGVFISTRIPAMLYIDSDGNIIDVTNGFQEQAALEEKLVSLGAG